MVVIVVLLILILCIDLVLKGGLRLPTNYLMRLIVVSVDNFGFWSALFHTFKVLLGLTWLEHERWLVLPLLLLSSTWLSWWLASRRSSWSILDLALRLLQFWLCCVIIAANSLSKGCRNVLIWTGMSHKHRRIERPILRVACLRCIVLRTNFLCRSVQSTSGSLIAALRSSLQIYIGCICTACSW